MSFVIIHITDSQIQGINPKGRIDNFAESMKAKFREVFGMAREILEPGHEVIIVHGGDLFNIPDLSDSVAGDFAELFLESPVPMYVVPGNHDEFVHNLDTIYRTKLGLLGRTRIVRILDREPEVFVRGKFAIQLTGQGYHPNMDINGEDYIAPGPKVYYKSNTFMEPVDKVWVVHAVHGMLTMEPVPGPHTYINDCQTNADVVLSGHLHKGFGVVVREKFPDHYRTYQEEGHYKLRKDSPLQLFCNPGAIARVDADPEEMVRPVQIAVLEFTDTEVEANLVRLQSAKPGSEVLSREHIVKATEREENMKKFLNLLNQEGEMRFLSVQEIVKDLSERKKLPKGLVDDLLRRIAKAREELGRKKVG